MECRIKVVETETQGTNDMNFADTQKVIDTIQEIETWARGVKRLEIEGASCESIKKYQDWLEAAKQAVFELCTK